MSQLDPGAPRRPRDPRFTQAPPEQRRLRYAASAFLVVLLLGFVGYQIILGVSPLDALYMTIITITTVGFREVVPLDAAGKALTIVLITAGVSVATYTALTAAEFVVEGHFRNIIERRRMQRDIARMRDHIIVCGFGRVGSHLADQLHKEGAPFVVVDSDDHKVETANDRGYLVVRGDATEEIVLEEAGLATAKALVAAVNGDADNVLISLTAKGLRPDLLVIGRAKTEENESKLARGGADRVIAPATIGGRRIAQILTRPVVADFLEGVGGHGVDYTFEEVPVLKGSELEGKTLRDAAVRERFGCTVIAIKHPDDERLDTHPQPDAPLVVGDTLVVMGTEDDVTAMRERFTRH